MQCHEKGVAQQDLLAEIGKVVDAEYNNSQITDVRKPPQTKRCAAKNNIDITSAKKSHSKTASIYVKKKINALKTNGENITITTEAAVYARNKEQRVQQKPHNTATKHHTVLQQNNASVANYNKNH